MKSWISFLPRRYSGRQGGDTGKDALQELEDGAACSEAHLMEMSGILQLYIQEVVYIDNNVPSVRLWSMKVRPIPSRAVKISKDGYRVWLTSHNDLGIIRYMVAMGTALMSRMIDPASFIDVIP
ncbi:Putative cyclic-di-GMP phosphodiesterase YlaB [Escherichia coli]|nr:Putative cyclic-di-GMP phosphodiesterase YlaB [Escherichia coli]